MGKQQVPPLRCAPVGMTIQLQGHLFSQQNCHPREGHLVAQLNCHPDRSVAQWRDLNSLGLPYERAVLLRWRFFLTITIFEWLLGFGVLLLAGRRLLLRCSSLAPSTARSPATRGWDAGWPGLCPTTSMTKRSSSAPTTPRNDIGQQRRAAFRRLAALYAQRFAQAPCARPTKSRTRSQICNSRRATAYPSSSAASSAST